MSQEIQSYPQAPVIPMHKVKPLEANQNLSTQEVLFFTADRIVAGFKAGHSPDFITGQIQKLIQDNPQVAQEMGWKDDFLWIKQNLFNPAILRIEEKVKASSPLPLGEEGIGVKGSNGENAIPSTHKLIIPGANGKDMTLDATGGQILDSAGNLNSQELKYVNAKLLGDNTTAQQILEQIHQESPHIPKNMIQCRLDEIHHRGGQSRKKMKVCEGPSKLETLGLGAMAIGGIAMAELGGYLLLNSAEGALFLNYETGIRAGTWFALHPTAGKWFNRSVDFTKGYLTPSTEMPQNWSEFSGIFAKWISGQQLVKTEDQ